MEECDVFFFFFFFFFCFNSTLTHTLTLTHTHSPSHSHSLTQEEHSQQHKPRDAHTRSTPHTRPKNTHITLLKRTHNVRKKRTRKAHHARTTKCNALTKRRTVMHRITTFIRMHARTNARTVKARDHDTPPFDAPVLLRRNPERLWTRCGGWRLHGC